MSKTSELEARVAELEAFIAANIKARDGIQGNVSNLKNDLIQLNWALESLQTGVEIGEVDWLYIMRDLTHALFRAQCIDALAGDINGP